ncbi:hypothetical protein [Streptomyces aurantiacus]|nr:hypothetical protein [Streptomyces aurantiacus]
MHIQSLAEAVDGRTVLRFAVSTARDIKVTAPVAGMICRLSTPKRYWYYTGSIWTQLAPAPVHKAKHEKHKKHARGVRGVRGAS